MGYSYQRFATSKGTILAAKVAWAREAAEQAAKWFKSGGWSNQNVDTDVEVRGRAVYLTVRSERYGWTGLADFEMVGSPFVRASVSLDPPKSGEDVDLTDVLIRMNDEIKKIPIEDEDSMDKVVAAISLWFSRTVNKIPTR